MKSKTRKLCTKPIGLVVTLAFCAPLIGCAPLTHAGASGIEHQSSGGYQGDAWPQSDAESDSQVAPQRPQSSSPRADLVVVELTPPKQIPTLPPVPVTNTDQFPTEADNSQGPASLQCLPASTETQNAILGLGFAAYSSDAWAVIELGEGNEPGETWYLIAGRGEPNNAESDFFFLTNTLSDNRPSGERFIPLSNPARVGEAARPDVVFQLVNWNDERRTQGMQALRFAQDNCL